MVNKQLYLPNQAIKIYLLFSVVAMLFFMNNPAFAKGLPPTWYPKEYKNITSAEWPKYQNDLDSFLKTAEDFNNTVDEQEAILELSFIVRRLGDIDWPEKQKASVAAYLMRFANAILSMPKCRDMVRDIDLRKHEGLSRTPMLLAESSIRSALKISPEIASAQMSKTWGIIFPNIEGNKGLRILVHSLLAQMYKQATAKPVAENTVKLNEEYSTYFKREETNLIRQILETAKISSFDNQKKAWMYLWNNYNQMKQDNLLQGNVLGQWRENIQLMINSRKDLSIDVPLQISNEAENIQQKYIFLYSAVFLANQQFSPSLIKNTHGLSKAKKLLDTIDEFYKKNDGYINKMSTGVDLLKLASKVYTRKLNLMSSIE